MHVSELQRQHVSELLTLAEQHGIENANRLRKECVLCKTPENLYKRECIERAWSPENVAALGAAILSVFSNACQADL